MNFIKTDFDRWVDEDEQDGVEADKGFGEEDDFSGMGGMGGMGGMPGMGGMGGMGGMPGMGGMGGMPGMGGMGGGPGGMDFEKVRVAHTHKPKFSDDFLQMMADFQKNNKDGAAGMDAPDSDSDDDDDGPPPLEDAPAA